MHSDFGRTQPNLGTLLDTETDILDLDVEVMFDKLLTFPLTLYIDSLLPTLVTSGTYKRELRVSGRIILIVMCGLFHCPDPYCLPV